MKILLGLDDQPYSRFAVRQAARLASNTWADVTLLASIGEVPKCAATFRDLSAGDFLSSSSFPVEADMLRDHWKLFLAHGPTVSPYLQESIDFQLVEIKDGLYEEMKIVRSRGKDLRLRLRKGNAINGILDEAREEGPDLIVIGCAGRGNCTWENPKDLPQVVASNSSCSVLILKEEKELKNITCCLDEESVTQDSLEMIKQFATIFDSSLKLVGLTQDGGMRHTINQELWRISDYYSSCGLDTAVRLEEISRLETTLEKGTSPDLLALWAGKKSLISRFFPSKWLSGLIGNSPCSVLILR